METVEIQEAGNVPPSRFRKGPKDSKVVKIVEQARSSKTGILKLTSENPQEVELLYKSILQWRARHPHEREFGIRKAKSTIYVWDSSRVEVPA